jgi:hypothetical protein
VHLSAAGRGRVGGEEQAEQAEVGPDQGEGDLHPGVDEERRGEQGERDYAEPLLGAAVPPTMP